MKNKNTFDRRVVALLVAAASMFGCAGEKSPLPLVGTLERDRIEVIAEARERITEILVKEGDLVQSGQVLMRLDSARQQAAVRQANAVRENAEQRLAELLRGPREESIREAQARLKGAADNQRIQQREFERVTELVERQLTSDFALNVARNNLESADAQVQTLRAVLDALVVGTTAEEIGQAQAKLDEAEAALEAQEISLARLDIVAPGPGRIDAIPYKLGAQPPAGATVVVLLAGRSPYARVYVPEALRSRVVPGLRSSIVVDGEDQRFAGEVRYVASEAAFTPYFALTERDRGRLSFLAEITLTDEASQALPSGVIVEVDFP